MPPHHHHHHHPPHHYLFSEPERHRLEMAVGSDFGRSAHRFLEEYGCPPEPRILLELILVMNERMVELSRQIEALLPRVDAAADSSAT